MAIYEYKIGMKLPVSAQVAGEVCEELEQRNGLTPHNLVEVSRPNDAPTHDLFEWDDTVAAEKYREVQARQVIRLIVKVPEKSQSDEPTRAFVSITTHETKRPECCYRSIDRVLRDASSREAMLDNARRELMAFQRKYNQFKELADVFRAIDFFAGNLLEEEVA